ncbi:ras-related protein Rab-33B [Dendroctonus ponderosae]|uniref:Uncharacterized protein n=1 Tax=Dendroctonus ponderosae TaxID=77166 RepID=J3JWT2_DENPD
MALVANSPRRNTFKVIIIGDSNVGKTTLTYRYCEGAFTDKPEATIGVDFRRKIVEIDGEPITLELWDTAGQERFRMSMATHYYRKTDAILLVYDVTNRLSFTSLVKWVEESQSYCMPDVPKILVGNKCDGVVTVATQEAQRFADIHNMRLFETSAKLDSEYDNIRSIFETLALKIKYQSRSSHYGLRLEASAPHCDNSSNSCC